MKINTAVYSNSGGHDINEDSYLCNAAKGLFIVADGLGGHTSGEKASAAAIEYLNENCTGGYDSGKIKELIDGANKRVFDLMSGKTTIAAAFAENGFFSYTNVGDSRVYYFRNNRLFAVSKDHSVCQAAVDAGMMSADEIRGSEDRSKLMKVLGDTEVIDINRNYPKIKMQEGDAFIVCSDGFWDYVYESEAEADLLKSDSAADWLKFMLKRHMHRSRNSGDNYTAICGIVSETDAAEPVTPPANKKMMYALIAALFIIAAALGALYLYRSNNASTDLDTEVTTVCESSDTFTDDTGDTGETDTSDTVSESEVTTESSVSESTSETTLTDESSVTSVSTSESITEEISETSGSTASSEWAVTSVGPLFPPVSSSDTFAPSTGTCVIYW